MDKQENKSAVKREPTPIWRRIAGAVWIALVALYFFWEAWTYSGTFAKLSEWQFGNFNKSWPTVTYAGLVLLFSLPGMLLLRRRKNKSPQPDDDASLDEAGTAASELAIALKRATGLRKLLFYVGAASAISAFVSLAGLLFLPGFGPAQQVITVGTDTDGKIANGPTTLIGRAILSRTATMGQDFIILDKEARFAPIMPKDDDGAVRYFVQLTPAETAGARSNDRLIKVSGVLLRNSLPGPLLRLYRNVGISVNDTHYVLYRYPATMRRPYILNAIQMGVVALIMFILWWFQNRHIRKKLMRPTP
ncbi:hypothetical protein [Novosphingobium album (ex Hu et al. 2023)]|uniref:Uncharacterized protein n=1 Tax=Novosphingobium album (ex Hu et al. 2023) TaxID=2930093 RepID=A0ABT0B5H3_9SPHN|nr:hypothetical protein [Novosphingobium album (ex Hu et al. 2023)]MCJ2180059.1 hypothetical protein [Novosphingobium album (ex Hu et al. 2023)]